MSALEDYACSFCNEKFMLWRDKKKHEAAHRAHNKKYQASSLNEPAVQAGSMKVEAVNDEVAVKVEPQEIEVADEVKVELGLNYTNCTPTMKEGEDAIMHTVAVKQEQEENADEYTRDGEAGSRVMEVKVEVPDADEDCNDETQGSNGRSSLEPNFTDHPVSCQSVSPRAEHKKMRSNRTEHVCLHCKESFTRTSHFKNHVCVDDANEIPSTNQIRGRESVKSDELIRTDKPFKCETCGKSYAQSILLTYHKRIHTGERPYTCRLCEKSFTLASTRNKHEETHKGVTLYKCSFCEEVFPGPRWLKLHERSHTGDKPFECRYCHKAFALRQVLTDHERIHTGERPFQCTSCGKTFAQAGQLMRHNRIHTGEKPFKCETCDKAFNRKFSLKKHERVHTGQKPLQCAHCGLSFVMSTALVRHELTHTDADSLRCNHCDKTFASMRSLVNHKRVHKD